MSLDTIHKKSSIKSLNTLKRERKRLLEDFYIAITPEIALLIDNAKSELELERISHKCIFNKK